MESTIYTVAGQQFELQHYGVKGMKWGVRRYQSKDGSLTPAGKKRYNQDKWDTETARKEYAKLDTAKSKYERAVRTTRRARNAAIRSTRIGATSPFKSAHRLAEISRQNYRNERKNLKDAKQAYKDQKKNVRKNTTVGQKMSHGAKKIPGIMAKVGLMYTADQIFYGGAGTRAVKSAIQGVGMLTITAVAKARGATDIHWYDKQGRKIV